MTQVKSGIIYSYQGKLTFDIIENILTEFKSAKEIEALDLIFRKRIYSIMVECLENTYRHNVYKPRKLRHDVVELSVIKDNDIFIIEVGNYISVDKISTLKQKVEQVNKLNREEISKLYRTCITKASISEKGGAGLGIIEIARNSRNRIEYHITNEDKEVSYLELKIVVSTEY